MTTRPDALAELLADAAALLNSLGIAGPNIRHAIQTEPDPKWDADERAVWDLTQDAEWCVCGRIWPCEAMQLAAAITASEAKVAALDVERLARAFLDPYWQVAFHRWMTVGWHETKNDEALPLAKHLARVYLALAATEGSER